MADTKNYGLKGVGDDVQFGKAGGRFVYNTGASDFRATTDGTTLSHLQVLTPVGDTDAATKLYVDNIAAGLDPKESCQAATTAAGVGTYATTPSNGQFTGVAASIDGVTLAQFDRVLVKDQADAKQNGIYEVQATTTTLTRASDMDGSPASEVSAGNFTFIEGGTVNSDSGWVLGGDGELTLNTDNLDWVLFSTSSAIAAGDALTKTGNTFNLDFVGGGGLTAATATAGADQIAFADATGGDAMFLRTWTNVLADLDIVTIGANGMVVRTAADTYAARTITASVVAGDEGISIVNGDGVSGNPTIGLDIQGTTASGGNAANTDSMILWNGTNNREYTVTELANAPAFGGGTTQIIDGDTSVTVADAGAGTVTTTVDGAVTILSNVSSNTFTIDSATTNADIPIIRLSATSTGTPLAGIGPSIEFEAETAAGGPGNQEVGGLFALEATDVGAATEDFDFVFQLMAGGAAAAEVARIASTGSITSSALTDNRVLLAGASGVIEDDANFTFNGTTMAITAAVDITGDLDVDNININLNTISSTAGTDLNITPLTGQQLVLDGTISIDAGVVTGATSITSTAFVGDLTGAATEVTVNDTADTTTNVVLVGAATGNQLTLTDGALTYNAGTGALSATSFVGAFTGAATQISPTNEATDTTTFPVFVNTATGDQVPHTNTGLTYNSNTSDLSSTLIAGIANANLVDKSAIETISAAWTFDDNIFILESASADADVAGDGQVWVRNDAPNTLMFTDDAGNDFTANNVLEIEYEYSSAVTSTDPGPGILNFNSVTIGSITTLYIDDVDNTGRDNSFLLDALSIGDVLTFRSASDPADYILASVSSVTDSTGWWTIGLTLINTGTIFTNTDPIRIGVEWQSQGVGATPTLITVADSTDTTSFPAFFESATGDLGPKTDASNYTYNATTGALAATSFNGVALTTGGAATNFLDETGSYTALTSNATHTGQVTGATALALDITAITAQPASGAIAAADTIITNDGGVLSEATFTQMDTYFNSSLGFGDVTASGSPLNNQVAVFTAATDIDSTSTFTWDATTLIVNELSFAGDTISNNTTDQPLILRPNGTGSIIFQNGSSEETLELLDIAAAVNGLSITAGATGTAGPQIGIGTGGEANVDIGFVTNGTGVLSVAGGAGTYEDNVTDADDIPNKQYVDDAVAATGGSGTLDSVRGTVDIATLGDQNIGAAGGIPADAIIVSVVVDVTDISDTASTVTVGNAVDGDAVYMATTENDPEVLGLYKADLRVVNGGTARQATATVIADSTASASAEVIITFIHA